MNISSFDDILSNAPLSHTDFIVYRAIPDTLSLKTLRAQTRRGAILKHTGYLHTSTQRNEALFYLNNTRDCYTFANDEITEIDICKTRPTNIRGTLFKIHVSPRSRFYDNSSFSHTNQTIQSEIILGLGTLNVLNISEFPKYLMVECRYEGIDEGFDEGIDEGIDEGFEKGIDEGIDEGFEKGFEKGFDEGIEKGFDEGFEKEMREI